MDVQPVVGDEMPWGLAQSDRARSHQGTDYSAHVGQWYPAPHLNSRNWTGDKTGVFLYGMRSKIGHL